jgi:hypothetical protein
MEKGTKPFPQRFGDPTVKESLGILCPKRKTYACTLSDESLRCRQNLDGVRIQPRGGQRTNRHRIKRSHLGQVTA